MLDGLNNFVDKVLGIFGSWYDDGYFFYAILVFGILALLTLVLVIVFFFLGLKAEPDPVTQIQIDVTNNAPLFCLEEKGMNNWRWINDTMFECYNTENASINLNDHHIT